MKKQIWNLMGKGRLLLQKLYGQAARALVAAVMAAACLCGRAYASEVVSQINSIASFALSIVAASGVVVTVWGVFEFASGYQSHDGTQQTSGLKRLIAGLLMFGAGSIMSMLGVSSSGTASAFLALSSTIC